MTNNLLGFTCPMWADWSLLRRQVLKSRVNNSDILVQIMSPLTGRSRTGRRPIRLYVSRGERVLTRDALIFYETTWNSKDHDILKLDAQLFSDRDLEFTKVRFHSVLKNHLPIEHKHSSSAKLVPSSAAPSLLLQSAERCAIAQARHQAKLIFSLILLYCFKIHILQCVCCPMCTWVLQLVRYQRVDYMYIKRLLADHLCASLGWH
jgi:hypothetical protein